MARNRFDLIVFDWDGTLSDSTAHIACSLQSACRDLRLPVPAPDAARYVIGLGLRDALETVAPTLAPADYPRLVERYRYHFLNGEPDLALFDGAREMLESLRAAGYFLAIATGKSRVGLNRALARSQTASLFDASRCADESFSKPNPSMLHELTRELGQENHRTVMIGDTTHDLQMALNAGITPVAVTYGAHRPEPLIALEPAFCATTVAELNDWLHENG